MITIENMDELERQVRRARARDIKQRCKETGNCDTCRDKERGQPCPYAGNPVNWRVREVKRRMMPMGKKRLRDMTWDDYGISKNRYKELKAFCLQYDEKKSKVRYGIPAVQSDGVPGSSPKGSPVERQAIENSMFLRDIRMIEEAAVRADPGVWKYILRSVTQGLSYEYIEYDEELGKIPMCRRDFYGTRKLFYSILNDIQLDHKSTVKT